MNLKQQEQNQANRNILDCWESLIPENAEGVVLISFVKRLLEITRDEERELACKAIANLKEPSNVWKLIAMKEIRNLTNVYDNQPNND